MFDGVGVARFNVVVDGDVVAIVEDVVVVVVGHGSKRKEAHLSASSS